MLSYVHKLQDLAYASVLHQILSAFRQATIRSFYILATLLISPSLLGVLFSISDFTSGYKLTGNAHAHLIFGLHFFPPRHISATRTNTILQQLLESQQMTIISFQKPLQTDRLITHNFMETPDVHITRSPLGFRLSVEKLQEISAPVLKRVRELQP